TQKELETIPILDTDDIEKKSRPFTNAQSIADGTIFLHHDIFTNGIAYFTLMFSMQSVPEKLLSAAGFLKEMLGFIGTKYRNYKDLNTLINLETGDIGFENAYYICHESPGDFDLELEVRVKVKSEKISKAFEIVREILFDPDFSDKKRIRELTDTLKSRMQASMMSSGHAVSSSRALSYISDPMYYNDKLSGLDFYHYVDELEKDFDGRIDSVIKDMKKVLEILLHEDNLMVDLTGSEKDLETVKKCTALVKERLSKKPSEPAPFNISKSIRNEGFRCPGQVQYVAKAGNFADRGLPYRGDLKVLKVIMGYDYLWNNVRVLGGAYGCMSAFARNGNMYLVSYRDPHLKNTIKIFDDASDFIKNFSVSSRDMTKFIIGTISDMDMPLTPRAEGVRSLLAYMSGITLSDIQKERDEVLSCDQEKIRQLAPYLEVIRDDEVLCVVGAEEKIDENASLFSEVRNLL
ncbi:MAG: insulinase family protein, partial [Lachnospiraceae bacterium]|nr:insulinase family protein [Lachnospiraceae bacterium]